MRERVLWVGDMARDDAAVERLNAVVNVIGRHKHPGLIKKAKQKGGKYHQVDYKNIRKISELAVATKSTLAVVTNDLLLAKGLVDEFRRAKPDMRIVGPNKWLARIESDKSKAREWINAIDPSLNPLYKEAKNTKQLKEAMDFFKSIGMNVAVKPFGPAGGRGVKVMGKNLTDHNEALAYAKEVIAQPDQHGVLLEEAFVGVEFNMQIMTDGETCIAPPITVDYSYRDDGDVGPPTGGMGSFAFSPGTIPSFLTAADYDKGLQFARALLKHVQAEYDHAVGDGQHFSGVFYPNFIITPNGLKVIEINARPGDPEWMNIEQIIDPKVNMADVYSKMASGQLSEKDIRFIKTASTVQYFVPADYARNKGNRAIEFSLDWEALDKYDVKVYFSSAEQHKDHYLTVGSSRPVAFAATGKQPWIARQKIIDAHNAAGAKTLEFRKEIGQKQYIDSLKDPRTA